MEYVLAAALGFAGGTVGGMLGVGGGILFVPALAIFLDEPQVRAEATSLLAIVPVGIVGAWRQHHFGNVRLRDGLLIGALSPSECWSASSLPTRSRSACSRSSFAILLLVIAAQLLRRAARAPARP